MKIPEYERAAGNTICGVCHRAYHRHPQVVFSNDEADPTTSLILNKLCSGAWPRDGQPDLLWVKL